MFLELPLDQGFKGELQGNPPQGRKEQNGVLTFPFRCLLRVC